MKSDHAVRFAAYSLVQFSPNTTQIKGSAMQQSTIYKELESMIEKNGLLKSPTEFDQLLKQMLQAGKITNADYRSLLESYLGKLRKTH